MTAVIWSGGADASDIFLLIAVIVFAVLAIVEALREPVSALLPAGLAFLALGLLAV
jgi:hypothetical protein